jgi:hypothetical protein
LPRQYARVIKRVLRLVTSARDILVLEPGN